MKRLSILFLVFLLLVSCNIGPNNNLKKDINKSSSNDSISLNLVVYNVSYDLHPLLDSIISAVTSCTDYNKITPEFVFSSYYEDEELQVLLECIDRNNFDYTRCKGVFFYDGYKFNYFGMFMEELFEETNQLLHYSYIKSDITGIDIDDTGPYWRFIYDKNELRCISYVVCGESWYDDSLALDFENY